MPKFFTVTDLISMRSTNFEEDVKKNIKEKIKNKECFKVFTTEKEARKYATKITPNDYWAGSPTVVTVEITWDVWESLESVLERVTPQQVFFPEPVSFTCKNVPAELILEFISAKGQRNTGRVKEFSLKGLNSEENEQQKEGTWCSLQ